MFTRKYNFNNDDLSSRFLLFAEGDEGDAGAAEGDASAEGDQGSASDKSANGGDEGSAGDKSADDWRASIQDEKLRTYSENFTSVEELAKAHQNFRKDLSKAITPLGKNPTDEQVTAYRKSAGIPETVDGYEFTVPEGHEITEADTAFQAATAEMFHKNNVSADQAKGFGEWWNEMQAQAIEAQAAGDKAFADESEAALKKEWPGEEYARNRAFADQAAVKVFGDQIDEVRNIETKDGRFVLDHPTFTKMLAQYGREMQEGKLGNIITDTERGGIDTEIAALGTQIDKARNSGDMTLANTLYQKQLELDRRAYGAGPVVGSDGRTA